MMNIKENQKNTELKGNIQIDSVINREKSLMPKASISFEEEFDKLLYDENELPLQTAYLPISPLVLNYDLSSFDIEETISFDTKTIDNVDAMFFLKAVNQSETINLKINDETSVINAENYKTMEISKTVGSALMRAMNDNKAVRLDFDNQVTVILKVSKEGKIDVSFFPQDREVENYLKNNIDYLKVRFDEQSIAYSNISYRPYKQSKNNKNKQGDENE